MFKEPFGMPVIIKNEKKEEKRLLDDAKKEKKELIVEEESVFDLENEGSEESFQDKVELLQKSVNDIVNKSRELNPPKLNPHWIFNNCGKGHDIIKKNFRTVDGEMNWQVLVDLLPEEQKEKWSYEKQRVWNEESAIKVSVGLLEEKKPASFNPFWLRQKDYGLYRHLRRKMKNNDTGEIEWDKFVDQLPEEWTEKWVMGIREEKKKEASDKKMKFTFDSSVERLSEVLNESDAESLSSSDINTLDPQLHSYFRRYIQREKGGIDWIRITREITPSLREKFKFPNEYDKLISASKRLNNLLIENDPESFSSRYIEKNESSLYTYIRLKVKRKNGKIDWDGILDEVDPKFRDRFSYIESQGLRISFETAVKDLNDILLENNPSSFSGADIARFDSLLYSYFRRNAKKDGGGIDWKRVLSGVDLKFQERFRYPKKFEDEYPTERYEDKKEVDDLLEGKKDRLLTFFGATSKEDKKKRNEICLEMINLAKEGNALAEEKLMSYLEILEADWLEKEESFDVYKVNADLLRERTKRCIYLYQEKGAAGFVWYLYTSLRKHTRQFSGQYKKIELDGPFRGGAKGEDKHDRMNFEELPN